MKFCFVVPNYNHTEKIEDVIKDLSQFQLPIYLVDDASHQQASELFEHIATKQSLVRLLRHKVNLGKGGAVKTGLINAHKDGYTHALQIDADGQHQTSDIERFMHYAEKYPDCVISGKPVYDESIPKHRYIARYITHFWVAVETLSLKLKDTMCGFRVYPLAATHDLLVHQKTGDRMDFDIEILVRLYWSGVSTRYLSTRVIYPEDGVSHFRSLEDNVLISWLHTRLFFGMLLRIPRLIFGRFKQ